MNEMNVCLMSSQEKLGSVLHQCVSFIAQSTNVFLSNWFDWQASLGKVSSSIGAERLISSPVIVTAVAHTSQSHPLLKNTLDQSPLPHSCCLIESES